MNKEEIKEFLSTTPVSQMRFILASIQEDIPADSLEIKNNLQEAINDYDSILDKIKDQLIFDYEIYNLLFVLEHLSSKSIQTIISSLDDFSSTLAQKDFSSISKPEKAMFVTSINILKCIKYFSSPVKEQNFKNLLLDIIASTIPLLSSNKIFFDNMQNELSDLGKTEVNAESIEFALSFYKKLNKIEQYFFMDSVLPTYIDNLYFVPEESLKDISTEEREERLKKIIAAQQLEYNILKFEHLQNR